MRHSDNNKLVNIFLLKYKSGRLLTGLPAAPGTGWL